MEKEEEIKVLNEEITALKKKVKELEGTILKFKKFYNGWVKHKTQLGLEND